MTTYQITEEQRGQLLDVVGKTSAYVIGRERAFSMLQSLKPGNAEPAAWRVWLGDAGDGNVYVYSEGGDGEPLYRHPAPPRELSDVEIKAIFLTNGFTLKDGLTDLKSYVYAAARAVLKAARESK